GQPAVPRASGLATNIAIVGGSGVLAVVLTCAWFGAAPRGKAKTTQVATADTARPAAVHDETPAASQVQGYPVKQFIVSVPGENQPNSAQAVPINMEPVVKALREKVAGQLAEGSGERSGPKLRVVRAPKSVVVKPGQKVSFPVLIERAGTGAVRVTLDGL